MGEISITKLLVVAALVVLLFGTKKLRTLGGDLGCLLYTSPSPRDKRQARMPSSA